MNPIPPSPSAQSKLADVLSHAATALVVLAIASGLSVAAAYWTANQVEREARLKFENAASDAHNAVESRIRAYSDVLLGARGLFIASDSVSRSEFRDFVDSLDLNHNYPGIAAVLYAQRITAGQKQAFEAAVRNDTSVDPRGYPDFAIKPPGDRPDYVVVQYIEPMEGNRAALGVDQAGEAVRLAALERARDSNRITASGKVTLAVDPRKLPGILMRLAVYRKGMSLATVAQRREAFAGTLSTAFIVTDLMRGVLSEQFLQQTHVRIHDAGFLDSPNELKPPAAENLMFDSDNLLAAPASPPASNDGKPAGPTRLSILDVGGRRWNLYVSARQAFVDSYDRWLPGATLLGGITISLLLFGLMRSLMTVGRHATTLAASITEDLRQSEARLARSQRTTQQLIEVLPNPVYFKGIDGRYLGVNKAWEAYFGVPRQTFLGKTVHDLYPDNPEVAARLHADDQVLWDRPGTRVYETSITTADGEQHDVIYYKATFTHADGSLAGLIGTIVDITERKRAEEDNARLAAIIESSDDAIVSRSLDLMILTWNAGAERLFGWSAGEAIGHPVSMLFPPEREEEIALNQTRLQAGRPLMPYDTVRLTKDGRHIDVSLAQSPIKNGRGEVTGVSLIFRDIAERKRAEEAARRQNELTQLLEALARATNEAQTPEEALQALLKLICAHGRWPVGHVVTFAPNSRARAPQSSLWQLEDRARFADIIEHSTRFDYAGHHGRFLDIILNQKKPAWMEDLCTVPVGPRGGMLVSKGMHAAFGFPVVAGDEVLALLEFFAAEPRPADTLLLANLTNVGAQLARVIEHERALNALREREHLMHLVTEGVPAMIAYYDRELVCRFANNAYCKLRNVDPQNVVGMTLREIVGEDVYRVTSPSIDLVKEGKPVRLRRQERTATGEIGHIEIHRVPDMSAEGEFRGYYVMVLDITEQVRAEEVRAQLAAIVENSGDAIWSRSLDGKFLSWNAAATRLFGWTRDEVIGRGDDLFLMPPERRHERGMVRARLARGENSVAFETLRLRKDGARVEVEVRASAIRDAEGNLASVAVTMNDITGRKRAEETRAKLAAIVENSNDAIFSRTLDGTILSWNAGAEKMLGYTAAEVIGKPIAITLPPGRPPNLATNNEALLRGEVIARESDRMTKDGRVLAVMTSHSPLKDNAGNIVGASIILQDITALKQTEAARALLEVQLRESQKMEAVGTLAGGIAHDFNNILGAIIGNAALARQDVGAGHRALVSLDEISKASQRAKDLVQQILAFSRRQPQQLRAQPLRPVVEDALKLLRATLPAGVELAIAVSDTPLYVLADATQIQQVLLNLGANAWHAMQGRAGRIEIGLDAVVPDATAVSALPGLQPGPHACLRVSDNGVGMDAATQARVFEPFFTTKAVDQGTGLGLSVVHGIVKAHHGAISLESAPGAGATFRIYFPAIAERRAEARPEPAAPSPARGGGQHVLYVDDDEAMVFLVTRMLEGLGYRVSGYEQGKEALAAVRAAPGDFDLVVTDFNMPGLSGLEVAQEIARVMPGLPVVITTGYITDELRANALQAGVRHVVYKPNTIDELCQVIQRLVTTASA